MRLAQSANSSVWVSLSAWKHTKLKSQKAVIIVLVILLVFLAAAVTLLIFKIKDMMDAADFSDAEESVRRREVSRIHHILDLEDQQCYCRCQKY